MSFSINTKFAIEQHLRQTTDRMHWQNYQSRKAADAVQLMNRSNMLIVGLQ